MAPKFLINKRTKTIWEYTPDLETNRDLEPYYGPDEPTQETALADAEVDSADDDLVDPVTGQLLDSAKKSRRKLV